MSNCVITPLPNYIPQGVVMNKLLDTLSEFMAKYPGLLPLIGLVLIILNLLLQFFQGYWIVESNLFLHIGLILSLIGILMIRPLG
jgi:hypothetical protein